MKKWIVPISIIALCVFIIILLIEPFTQILVKNKEEKIRLSKEKEMNLAHDINTVYEENTSNIKDIQCGNKYTVILKDDGTVWVTGENYYVYDIIEKNGEQVKKFTKMKLEDIEQIAVGDNFVLALNSRGEVYSWGGNTYHQLGISGITKRCYEEPQKLDLKNIAKIYAYNEQSAALSKDGKAYYWGYSVDDYNVDSYIKEFDIDKVNDIFVVFHKFYFKTVNNEIYGVGYNFDGITTQVNGWARKPEKIEIQDVKEIICGQRYLQNVPSYQEYVVKNDGTVSILNVHDGNLETHIDELKDIVKVQSFQENNIQYALFLDKNGNVYTNNESSLDGTKFSNNYKKINISNVKDIVVSQSIYYYWNCIILIKEDGTIWNLAGTILDFEKREGGYSPNRCIEPEQINVENIKRVAFGENYIIVADNNNKLYRKGYNSVGQLGLEEQDNISELDLLYKSDSNFYFDRQQIETDNEIINTKENNSNYDTTPNEEEPYWTQLENGEYILIDPAMSTMAD